MNLQDLGETVKTERKRRGLTAQTLAQLANVDRTLISKLENKKLPELGYAKVSRILAILGLELSIRPEGGLPTLNDLQRENALNRL
jgi:transcriptional regulator with XRE-family HTH domain